MGQASETSVRRTIAGNPNLQLRFDTTVRYDLRLRSQDLDQIITGNAAGLGDVAAFQSDPSHWHRQLDRGQPLLPLLRERGLRPVPAKIPPLRPLQRPSCTSLATSAPSAQLLKRGIAFGRWITVSLACATRRRCCAFCDAPPMSRTSGTGDLEMRAGEP